jgi:GT2 family glycosyltransferase
MNEPFVISVILNTNRRDDTLACLASLAQTTYTNHRVIVLDNGSTDGSVPAAREQYPDVKVAPLEENLGYAGNNNFGIQMALDMRADWVFVLNEDTILDPDCLRSLVTAGEQDSKVGIVGPMVYHHDEPTIIQSGGGILGPYWESIHLEKDQIDAGQLRQNHFVEWVSGCAILVRRSVIETAGMLDARFFYFWEETEWCLRAGKAGWKILHVPAARIWHKGVQRNYTPKPSLIYYDTRNHLLLLQTHHAPLKAWLKTLADILRTLVSWSIRPKWRGKRLYRDAMWHGLLDFTLGHWGKQPEKSAP